MTAEQPDSFDIRVSMTGDARPGQRVVIREGTVLLRFSRAAVAEAIENRLGPAASADPKTRQSTRRAWLATACALGDGTASGLFARSPRAAAHFEQVLIHGLLDSHPDALLDQALPIPLRKAMNFCAKNAGDPISITDIANAASLGVRTLQRMFRTSLGVSPLEYLQRLRLERAHDDLTAIAAGEASGTVTEVALRWGFTHLGRFAGLYRKSYGHSPVQTLRDRMYAIA